MSDQGSAARSSSPEAAAAPSFAERLKTGVGGDDARLRASLELAADADDTAFARALVEATAKRGLADIAIDREAISEPPAEAPPPAGADSSFLGRLSVAAEQGSERPGVDELEDVHTLLAVVRAGTLAQRRAAVLRLGSLLHLGKPTNEEVRSIATSLLGSRDVEIAFEVGRAREALPGARGREARQERESFDALIPRVIAAIDDFWSGQSNEDPIRALPPEDLAQLMVRLRDAPEAVVAHIASVIDGSDGVGDRDARRAMLSSVRLSGDPRLVPTLVGILESRVELGTDAARALARIEDPRVPAALARAYDRSVVDAERAVLAGALGIAGDTRARDYVRPLLGSDDERVLFVAVRAMEALATAEDTERLTPLLTRSDPVLLSHVIRALGRSGDPRALPPLLELRSDASLAALFGDIDDAEATIAATMELRGEERPEATESFALQRATATGMAQRERDPIVVRLQGWWDFAIGHLWLGLGASRRAVARFERAASRRPGWAGPLAAIALHHARQRRVAQALGAFRRALEADKRSVEGNLYAIRTLAKVFLRRADEVERGGRVDIARGLIDEVLTLDLRRVPNELRFELSRRQEQLRLRGAA